MSELSPLRQRYLRFMQMKRYSPKTIDAYMRPVVALSQYYHCSPDRLSLEQVQRYLFYLLYERELAWSSCNVAISSFCRFFNQMLGYTDWKYRLPPRPRTHQLPMLLDVDEVKRLINAPRNLKHKVILHTIYSAGLRVSEVTRLKPGDIESHPERMLIRVNQGKGRKDRYTLLAQSLLPLLRDYWRGFRPAVWLFPGRPEDQPITISTVQHIYQQAKHKAGIEKGRGVHTLRHCFASHLLAKGVNIFKIKELLGHQSIKTTWTYCHVGRKEILDVTSPLDVM